MTQIIRPIEDPAFWKQRLDECDGQIHKAILVANESLFKEMEAAHKKILADLISDQESILDVGCGYGRLLDMLPESWIGCYTGIDLSPDLVHIARKRHPNYQFIVDNFRWSDMGYVGFDTCVTISMRQMIRQSLGDAAWNQMQAKILRLCKRLIVLEFGCIAMPSEEKYEIITR